MHINLYMCVSFYHQGAARDEVAPMKNINKKLINNIFSDLRKAANHPLLCTTRFSGNVYGFKLYIYVRMCIKMYMHTGKKHLPDLRKAANYPLLCLLV